MKKQARADRQAGIKKKENKYYLSINVQGDSINSRGISLGPSTLPAMKKPRFAIPVNPVESNNMTPLGGEEKIVAYPARNFSYINLAYVIEH